MPRTALLFAALVTSSLWLAVECLAFARVALAVALGHMQLVHDDSLDKSYVFTTDPRVTWHWPTVAGVGAAALVVLVSLAIARRVRPTLLIALASLACVLLLAGFAQSWRLSMPTFAGSFTLSLGITPLLRSLTWLGAGLAVVAALTATAVMRRCAPRALRATLIAWLAGSAFLALDVAAEARGLNAALLEPGLWTSRNEEAFALATSTSARHAHLIVLLAMLASAIVAGRLARGDCNVQRDHGARAFNVVVAALVALVMMMTTAAALLLSRETSAAVAAHSALLAPAQLRVSRTLDTPWPSDVAPLPGDVVNVVIDGAELFFEGALLGWANREGTAALEEKLVDQRQRCLCTCREPTRVPSHVVALFASSHVSARDVAKRAQEARDLGYEVKLAFVDQVHHDRPLLGPTRLVLAGVSASVTARMFAGGSIEGAETYGAWVARTAR